MKSSLTFRDEKSPLIRMKFPVTLAGFPLTSGIVLGDNQDLSLHLGTSAEACPSVKVEYWPNLPTPSISLIVKAGVGPWGPPRTAALSLSAELRFSRVACGPFFTVHVKPRLGDFGLRKMTKLSSFGAATDTPTPRVNNEEYRHAQLLGQNSRTGSQSFHHASSEAPHVLSTVGEASRTGIFDDVDVAKKNISGTSVGLFGDAPALTPIHLDKNSLFTPIPFRGQSFNRKHERISEEAESLDSGGNDFVKIEGSDRSNRYFQEEDINFGTKAHELTSNVENFRGCQSHSDSATCNFVGGGSCINEPDLASIIKTIDFLPVPWLWGVDESSRGWSLQAHSTLPLGSHTALKFRWGMNANRDFLQGLDSQLPNFKLPYLYLQKVSILSMALASCKEGSFPSGAEFSSFPRNEKSYEPLPAASLHGSMKRQLQLLYAENQVLKKAMEEMKAQFEQRTSIKQRGLAANLGDIFAGDAANDLAADAIGDSTEVHIKR